MLYRHYNRMSVLAVETGVSLIRYTTVSLCYKSEVSRIYCNLKYFSKRKEFASKVWSPGKCGFVNLGNTVRFLITRKHHRVKVKPIVQKILPLQCFVNCVLQCLRHTKPLAEFCLDWECDNKSNENMCLKGSLFLGEYLFHSLNFVITFIIYLLDKCYANMLSESVEDVFCYNT